MSPVLLLSLSMASAASPDLRRAAYLGATGRHDEHCAIAVRALQRDPNDLDAHIEYIAVRGQGFSEADALEVEYEAWLAQRPDDPVRRTAVAMLRYIRRGDAACPDVIALLDPLPDHRAARGEAARLLSSCDVAQDANQGGWQLDSELDTSGPFTEVQLERILHGSDPIAVWEARTWALRLRRTDLADRLGARLDVLDPEWRGDMVALGGEDALAVTEANQRVEPQVALDALDALDAQLPADGPTRGMWAFARARRLQQLGQVGASYEAVKHAWRADPTEPVFAVTVAKIDAFGKRDLDEGLVAIRAAIALLEQATYDGMPSMAAWDHWHADRLERLREALEIRSRLLALGGETPTGIAHPLLDETLPEAHLRVGLDTTGLLGQRHLERAAALAGSTVTGLAAMEELESRKVWTLAGLDTHIDALRRAPDRSLLWSGSLDATGRSLADLSFEVDGMSRTLEDFPGPARVIYQ